MTHSATVWGKYRPALCVDVLRGRETPGRHPLSRERAAGLFSAGRGLRDMASGPSLPELIGIGDDNRVSARVDLEEDLNL